MNKINQLIVVILLIILVTIEVGHTTDIKGAIIASGKNDSTGRFEDANNLYLSTGELEYSDLYDFDTSKSSNYGAGTYIGTSTDKGTNNKFPSGSTTITAQNQGHETKGLTKATLGQGQIIVGGQEQTDLQGLNRDVNTTQELTKDEITHALDGSVTIDNRLLTEAGRESIANDFANLKSNTAKATAGAAGTITGTGKIIGDVITGDTNIGDAADAWKSQQSGMATGIKRAGDTYINEVLTKVKSGTATPEEIQNILKITGIEGQYNLVYTDKGEFALIDGENKLVNGFNDQLEKQGYVNLANGAATNADTLLRTDAEERAHNYTKDENLARNAANNELNYYNLVANWTGGTTTYGSEYGGINQTQYAWNQTHNTSTSSLLANNTQKSGQVSNQDKAYATGPSIVAGVGAAMSYHGMAELLGDGDAIKGHQIIQSDPKYRAIADKVNNAVSTVGEVTTPVADAIGGAPARIVGGIKVSMGGNITQDDVDAMNPISSGSEKTVAWIQQKIDENADNPEAAAYYKHLLSMAATTAIITEGVSLVKGGIGKTIKPIESNYSQHFIERAAQRGVSKTAIDDALKNPLKIESVSVDSLGRPSQIIIGKNATVVVNPETGKLVTTWPTGTSILNKMGVDK